MLIPKHWTFGTIPNPQTGGTHGTSPTLADLFHDEAELGQRVAYAYDDESIWQPVAQILFMAAPGAPWDRR